MIVDYERMLICDICGEPSVMGFDVTVDGIRMGDVGHWRCSKHHRDQRERRYTREEWEQARAEGWLYPRSTPVQEAAE